MNEPRHPTKHMLTEDEKRISAITLRIKRYVLDARYTNHNDWWEQVNAQDVQFLLAIIDQQQARMASLEAAYDNLNPVSSNPWKDM